MSILIRNKLSQKDIEAISYLLKDCPPFLVSSGTLPLHDYTKYFINSTRHFLHQNEKTHLIVIKKSKILGMALLRFIEWDSNFFKTPIGCIEYILTGKNQKLMDVGEIENELLNNCSDLAKELGIRVLYISINARRHSLVNVLNSLRFNFICAEMERAMRKSDAPYLYSGGKSDGKDKFRKYRKEDYSQVIRIAEEISLDVNSKFSLNPYLPRKEKESYYLESIKNCCLGLNADDIFVADKNKDVAGFVCYKYDTIFEKSLGRKMSFLVMEGISRSERRKNVGTQLVDWAHKQIFKNSEVILLGKVYLHNLPMIRFILRRGSMLPFDFIYTFCKKL